MVDEVLDDVGDSPAADDTSSGPEPSTRDIVEAAVEKQRGRAPAEKHETIEATAPDGRARDEKGRFAPKDEEEAPADKKQAPGKPVEAKVEGEAPKVGEASSGPPAALSAAVKHDWPNLPQNVRDEFTRREADHLKSVERYQGLAAFANIAERNGTTIAAAVAQYNKLENTFMRDPLQALDEIFQRLNINPQAITIAMQAKYGGLHEPQTQGQPGPQPPYNGNGRANPGLSEEQARELFRKELADRDILAQVNAFQNDPENKFFENVRNEMAAILTSGLRQPDGSEHTLKSAYELALRMNPETFALVHQSPQPAPADPAMAAQKARAAAKAVGGAPSPGLKPGSAIDTNLSTRDVVLAAINAQRGTV